ncbi:hypothetical protein [Glutamicibacter sp. X7]
MTGMYAARYAPRMLMALLLVALPVLAGVLCVGMTQHSPEAPSHHSTQLTSVDSADCTADDSCPVLDRAADNEPPLQGAGPTPADLPARDSIRLQVVSAQPVIPSLHPQRTPRVSVQDLGISRT